VTDSKEKTQNAKLVFSVYMFENFPLTNTDLQSGRIMYFCNPSTQEAEEEDCEFEPSLSYIEFQSSWPSWDTK
jgi:hypothetical protein